MKFWVSVLWLAMLPAAHGEAWFIEGGTREGRVGYSGYDSSNEAQKRAALAAVIPCRAYTLLEDENRVEFKTAPAPRGFGTPAPGGYAPTTTQIAGAHHEVRYRCDSGPPDEEFILEPSCEDECFAREKAKRLGKESIESCLKKACAPK